MTEYSDTFIIRNYHTGPSGHAFVPALFNFMYEAAGDHCIEDNITVQDLQKIGLTWMLSRINVEFTRIPTLHETVTVKTWPTGPKGLFSCRDFELIDESGNEFARATSAWLTINLEKRRVVRLPQQVLDIHPKDDSFKRMIEDDFKEKLTEPDCENKVHGFRADYSTLDVNTHVTSAVYIRWMLDALPFEFHKNKSLKNFEINHKMEILPGQDADVCFEIDGNEVIHSVIPASGGPANCVAKSVWI